MGKVVHSLRVPLYFFCASYFIVALYGGGGWTCWVALVGLLTHGGRRVLGKWC